jgi:hypothetical protein
MKQLLDTVWQRRGTSWIWDETARNQVCTASEIWSLRKLIQARGNWPNDLPSNGNNTLVVAGMDGCLDLLTPDDAQTWLGDTLKEAIFSFQSKYNNETALIFWLPSGRGRIKIHPATDATQWQCAAPYGDDLLDFGRILWGDSQYLHKIFLSASGKPIGLFHSRIT